jgi:hypothetical protein
MIWVMASRFDEIKVMGPVSGRWLADIESVFNGSRGLSALSNTSKMTR